MWKLWEGGKVNEWVKEIDGHGVAFTFSAVGPIKHMKSWKVIGLIFKERKKKNLY